MVWDDWLKRPMFLVGVNPSTRCLSRSQSELQSLFEGGCCQPTTTLGFGDPAGRSVPDFLKMTLSREEPRDVGEEWAAVLGRCDLDHVITWQVLPAPEHVIMSVARRRPGDGKTNQKSSKLLVSPAKIFFSMTVFSAILAG